jgi:acyl-homoserine lactone acylase PvdQ
VDAFILKLDPQNPERYWYKGTWRTLEKRTETIRVKGGEPVELTVYRSVYGPVVATDARNAVAVSLKLSYWNNELEAFRAFYGFLTARTVEDFERAASHIPASFNAFCATRTGDIAYFYCGRAPIRADGVDPRLPALGTGEYDWKGTIPFSEMPRVVNPKQGYIANWNNKPAVWWENADTPVWGMIFRVYRLNDLIRSKPRLTVDDVKAYIRDIAEYDEDAGRLLPIMLRIVKRNERNFSDELRAAVRLLEAWDCHEREGSAAKALWDAWLDAVRTRVFADDLGNFFSPDLFRLAIQPSYIGLCAAGQASRRAAPARLLQWQKARRAANHRVGGRHYADEASAWRVDEPLALQCAAHGLGRQARGRAVYRSRLVHSNHPVWGAILRRDGATAWSKRRPHLAPLCRPARLGRLVDVQADVAEVGTRGFSPHPLPLSWPAGEGCRGARRCALTSLPLRAGRCRLTPSVCV